VYAEVKRKTQHALMEGDQMATTSFEVKNYAVDLFSGRNLRFNQRIFMYQAEGNIGAVAYFYEEGVTMPPPTGPDPASGNMIRLAYRSNRFASVLDVLRNEEPIYVFFDDAGYGAIGTHVEPVGEEES
jgi:hypothetical protein